VGSSLRGTWEVLLYLELASECFNKSTAANDPGASETMQ
jgi:hypothetical protein